MKEENNWQVIFYFSFGNEYADVSPSLQVGGFDRYEAEIVGL
jgi:hypothetical protein